MRSLLWGRSRNVSSVLTDLSPRRPQGRVSEPPRHARRQLARCQSRRARCALCGCLSNRSSCVRGLDAPDRERGRREVQGRRAKVALVCCACWWHVWWVALSSLGSGMAGADRIFFDPSLSRHRLFLSPAFLRPPFRRSPSPTARPAQQSGSVYTLPLIRASTRRRQASSSCRSGKTSPSTTS